MKLAQSLPEDGKVIQRTIVDEQDLKVQNSSPAQTQANSTVLYGLAAVVLLLIVVIAIGLLWSKQQNKK